MATKRMEAGSASAAVPQQGAPRLRQGALSMNEVASATMANIGPAMSFYFGFATIAAAAGVGSPIVILVSAIALMLIGRSLSEFSRVHPSAGSYITFIGITFGPVCSVTGALLLTIAYATLTASVVAISGGWTHIILLQYLGVNIPWQALTLIITVLIGYLMFRGVSISVRVAAALFLSEMAILLVVAVAVLIQHWGTLTLRPFDPTEIKNGFSGLGLAFPLAFYLFGGWDASAALAEETANPRRNVPRAIFASIILMFLTYFFLAYATVVGFNYRTASLANAAVPFITLAQGTLGVFVILAYVGGLTSILSSMVGSASQMTRVIFNSAREGMLPSPIARMSPTYRTPWASICLLLTVSLAIVYIFGWSTDPVVFFGEVATLGTIYTIIVYAGLNVAVPVYFLRTHRGEFSILRHLCLPILGVLSLALPFWGLIQPGQPSPFNVFPYLALALAIAALIYSVWLTRRDPTLGDRVGSFIADMDDPAALPAGLPATPKVPVEDLR